MNDIERPMRKRFVAVVIEDDWMRSGEEEAGWVKEALSATSCYRDASIVTVDLGPLRAQHKDAFAAEGIA